MYTSFYAAGAGANAQQRKIDVVANNLANINTTAYKNKTPIFSELMYVDLPDPQANHLQNGKGVKLSSVNSTFKDGGFYQTGGDLDFAIQGDGFFALSDMEGENIRYTRDGRFMMSNLDDTLYLTNSSGLPVLNADGEMIEMTELTTAADMEDLKIGVFTIPVQDGMIEDGFNNFRITEKNGEPEALEDPRLQRGYLENSNVDMSMAFSQVIEAQRAYTMSLRMVQTSDEIEQEINSLRR